MKLHSSILQSTLWFQPVERDVFITALLLAQPRIIREELPQIEPDSLRETGFKVPPGRYGFCETSGVGLVKLAGVDLGPGMEALKRLGSPEPDSRSPEHEGRRLCRVAGGYVVLNYRKYRDKDNTAAQRMRDWRQKKREEEEGSRYGELRRNVTQVTHADADADAEASASASAVLSSQGSDKLNQPDSARETRTRAVGGGVSSSGSRTRTGQPGNGSLPGRAKTTRSTSAAPAAGPLPKGWRPTAATGKLCTELGLNLAAESAKFRDHARSTGRLVVDWHAAFNNWLRESSRRKTDPSSAPASSRVDRRFPEPQPHTGAPLKIHREIIE